MGLADDDSGASIVLVGCVEKPAHPSHSCALQALGQMPVHEGLGGGCDFPAFDCGFQSSHALLVNTLGD